MIAIHQIAMNLPPFQRVSSARGWCPRSLPLASVYAKTITRIQVFQPVANQSKSTHAILKETIPRSKALFEKTLWAKKKRLGNRHDKAALSRRFGDRFSDFAETLCWLPCSWRILHEKHRRPVYVVHYITNQVTVKLMCTAWNHGFSKVA